VTVVTVAEFVTVAELMAMAKLVTATEVMIARPAVKPMIKPDSLHRIRQRRMLQGRQRHRTGGGAQSQEQTQRDCLHTIYHDQILSFL
jgi:Tfp pilus assembly pilus retraction ATPase PilT